MSWNIKTIGTRKNVRAIVLADVNIPKPIKDGIVAVIEDVTETSAPFVRVETYGHFGGGYSSIGKLEVEPVQLAPEAPEPAPAASEAPKVE